MTRLFDRRVSITIDDKRFDSAIEGVTTVPGFRIAFEVAQSNDSKANKAQATIWHLSESSRAKFSEVIARPTKARKRPQFIIEAGYVGTQAVIFNGEAVHVGSVRVAGGFETQISAQDGLQAKRAILAATLSGQQQVGQMIKQIAEKMGVNATRAIAKAVKGDFSGAFQTVLSGAVLSGPADKVMDDMTRSTGAEWSIQNGELVILTKDGFVDEEVIVLGPRSGLIRSPERRRDEKKNREIIVVRSMMQPRMAVGRKLQLESNEISGLFRIETVKHAGDTHSADWYSEAEAIGV